MLTSYHNKIASTGGARGLTVFCRHDGAIDHITLPFALESKIEKRSRKAWGPGKLRQSTIGRYEWMRDATAAST